MAKEENEKMSVKSSSSSDGGSLASVKESSPVLPVAKRPDPLQTNPTLSIKDIHYVRNLVLNSARGGGSGQRAANQYVKIEPMREANARENRFMETNLL